MGFRELQEQVRGYDAEKNWIDPSSHIVLHMSEEVGEIARWMLKNEGYKKGLEDEDLGMELTDLMYLLLKLANNEGVDLESEWESMWSRYETKEARE